MPEDTPWPVIMLKLVALTLLPCLQHTIWVPMVWQVILQAGSVVSPSAKKRHPRVHSLVSEDIVGYFTLVAKSECRIIKIVMDIFEERKAVLKMHKKKKKKQRRSGRGRTGINKFVIKDTLAPYWGD